MRYKVAFLKPFSALLTIFFQQVSNRFADFRQHVSKFFVLDPKHFYNDDVNSRPIHPLQTVYVLQLRTGNLSVEIDKELSEVYNK